MGMDSGTATKKERWRERERERGKERERDEESEREKERDGVREIRGEGEKRAQMGCFAMYKFGSGRTNKRRH